ncbi:MAG: endonuclease/exonuclease/phosphatase family protein [Bacteroidota bacterium]
MPATPLRFLAPFLLGLSLTMPVWAQVPPVGTEATFDVATWNVEWFGNDSNGPSDEDLQFERARQIIAGSGIDLWGLQEMADEATFSRLLDSLGTPYEGFLATQSGQLRIGYLYDSRVIRLRNQRHILTEFNFEFAGRPPLLMEADVTLSDTTLQAVFVVLHMKAGSQRGDYERRRDAVRRLKTHLDFFYADVPLIVLGDFNDELRRSIWANTTSPYAPFNEDTTAYTMLSRPLDEANLGTFCSTDFCNGSTIDHIMISDEWRPFYQDGSMDRWFELVSVFPGYSRSITDHLPVYARFERTAPINTSRTQAPERPTANLQAYPTPFSSSLTIELEQPHSPDRATVYIYDVLGREVAALAVPPSGRVDWVPPGLPSGVYLLRTSDGRTALQPVIYRPR